jgi:hypothetical protein
VQKKHGGGFACSSSLPSHERTYCGEHVRNVGEHLMFSSFLQRHEKKSPLTLRNVVKLSTWPVIFENHRLILDLLM